MKDEFHEEVNGRRIDPWIGRPLEGLRVVRPCVGLSGTSHVIKTPSFEWRRPFNTAAAAKKGDKSKSKSKRVAAKKYLENLHGNWYTTVKTRDNVLNNKYNQIQKKTKANRRIQLSTNTKKSGLS